jgi:hypothetical protein
VTLIYAILGLMLYAWPVLLAMFMIWWAAWCWKRA